VDTPLLVLGILGFRHPQLLPRTADAGSFADVDHRTILDAVDRVAATRTPVTALTIAADLGVDDEEVLEDIGDALAELVEAGRLVRVETRTTVAGRPSPFPTITYAPAPHAE
jgi:hypothetical protein